MKGKEKEKQKVKARKRERKGRGGGERDEGNIPTWNNRVSEEEGIDGGES